MREACEIPTEKVPGAKTNDYCTQSLFEKQATQRNIPWWSWIIPSNDAGDELSLKEIQREWNR